MAVRNLTLIACSLLALFPASAHADELSEAASDVIPAQRETYRVGIALLSGELEPDDRIVLLSFPRIVYAELSQLTERTLSESEIDASRSRRRAAALQSVGRELMQAIDARDALLFDLESDAEKIEAADERVATARALLDELQSVDDEAIEVSHVRPIVFLEQHESGEFIELSPGEDRARVDAAESNDLDLLLWGEVDEVEGYLAIDLYAYYPFLGSDAPADRTIVRSSDASLEAEIMAEAIAGEILGREYASLVVTASEAQASIAVNGELQGFGEVRRRYLAGGEASVLVEAEGFVDEERVVDLVSGATTEVSVSLEPLRESLVRIQSSPVGASVYADSVWIGTTPLEMPVPETPAVVRITSDGYLDSRFVVDRGSPPVVSRVLLPAAIDWTTEIRRERDEFYQALTWFVLSIPVTIILRGGYESVLGAYPPGEAGTLSDEELQRLARRGNIFYWSSIGGLLVNAGLLVNLGLAIVEYVEVGEGSHNQ